MLIISRKQRERIYIGPDTFIEVRRIEGNRVRLAVHAPKDVVIQRGELREERKAG